MKKSSSALALAVSSLALGGCQALFGTPSFASRTPAAESASLDMSDYFTARLESGRAHMAQGRPGAAVTAFRQASYDPAHAGRAYNGMAVAYAQLGRPDLARRYFTMAIAADPLDERFARNLARLDDTAVSEASREELAGAAHSPAETPAPGPGSIDRAGADNGSGLLRVSSREVQIVSAAGSRSDKSISSDQSRSLRSGTSVAVIQTGAAASYPVRIELPRAAAPRRANYPVRIALSDVKVSQRPSYPVRIELPDAN